MKLEHMKQESESGAKINLDALYKICPACFTETTDSKTGELRKSVNFETLRQLLGDFAEDDAPEAYEFTWPGKQEARREVARPCRKTLRPVVEDSKDWDTTQNLYIEGDNLEVLKLLQKSYLGKVKMIYIDPPYNTGEDFVYDDDFSVSQNEYDQISGNVDEYGNKLRKNTDSNGKFHSDWCSMIYSRLMLARTLLTEDGVIFVSIDDNEERNLKNICDEVFGEGNFVGNLILQTATDNNPRQITTEHEYILCYAKDKDKQTAWQSTNEKAELIQAQYLVLKEKYHSDVESIQQELRDWIKKNEKKLKGVAHYDNVDEKGVFHDGDIANTVFGDYIYDVIHPITGKVCKIPEKGFRFPKSTMEAMIARGDIMFGEDETTLIKPKKRLENAKDVLRSVIYEDGRASTKQFESLLSRDIFQNPKSPMLLQRLFGFILKPNDILLDFFSGSGTSAEAVFRLCAKEKMDVKFILVQIAENLDESYKNASNRAKKTIANSIKFLDSICKPHTICEIGKERIRRAGAKILEDLKANSTDGTLFEGLEEKQTIDVGFRVFRTDSSNMKDVYFSPKDYSQDMLGLFFNNVKDDRNDLDLLFGCMLDWGVQLSLPMAKETVDGCDIYTVNEGDLVACFSENITENVVRAIAEKAPLRVIFRDSSFAQDDAKINVYESFKQLMDWSDDEVYKNIRVI